MATRLRRKDYVFTVRRLQSTTTAGHAIRGTKERINRESNRQNKGKEREVKKFCKVNTEHSLFVAERGRRRKRNAPYLSQEGASGCNTKRWKCSLFVAVLPYPTSKATEPRRKRQENVKTKSWKSQQLPYLSPRTSLFVAEAENNLPICRRDAPKVSQQCSLFVAPPSQSVADSRSQPLAIRQLHGSTNQ